MFWLTIPQRNWSLRLWSCPSGDLLLQAADHLRLSRLLDGLVLYSGRIYGFGHPSIWPHRTFLEPRPFQLEGTRVDYADGFRSISVCFGD